MKYKITEVTTLRLKVEYEDGSWALIPTAKDADKNYYAQRIVDFCQTPQEPVAIGDIPYSVGHEGEVGDDVSEGEVSVDKFTASDLREACFPALGEQFDALYHARGGDDSMQTEIDAHIKFVKDNVSMDDTVYTWEQVLAKRQEFIDGDNAFKADLLGL